MINSAGKVDGGVREFMVLTPGGGVGPNTGGCSSQYGMDWYVITGPVWGRRKGRRGSELC